MKRFEEKIQHALWSVVDFFYPPFHKVCSLQFFRYGFTGGLNMAFDTILYYVFYHYVFHSTLFQLGDLVTFTPHIASFVFKWPITFLTGFWLARHITFSESSLGGKAQIFRYLMVSVVNVFIVYGGLKFFVEVCGIFPTLSYILIGIISVLFSYFFNRFFSFRISNHNTADNEDFTENQ